MPLDAPPTTEPPAYYATAPVPSGIQINGYKDGQPRMIVSISMADGKVTFGEGVTPEGAAKAFWEQITRLYPSICKVRDDDRGR